jgi:hypothetical protein
MGGDNTAADDDKRQRQMPSPFDRPNDDCQAFHGSSTPIDSLAGRYHRLASFEGRKNVQATQYACTTSTKRISKRDLFDIQVGAVKVEPWRRCAALRPLTKIECGSLTVDSDDCG